MQTFFKPYLAALLVISVLDALWLGVLARDFYREALGALMAEQARAEDAVTDTTPESVATATSSGPTRWTVRSRPTSA